MVHWHHPRLRRVLWNAPRTCTLCGHLRLTEIVEQIVTRVLLNKPTYTDSVTNSPYFSGIIFSSMIWLAYVWVTRLLQRTSTIHERLVALALTPPIEAQSHAFTHLIFALTYGLCAYNFFRAITLDPGTCPKPTSDAELKSVCGSMSSAMTLRLTQKTGD